MAWCPKCGTEYIQGITICKDCNKLLTNTPPVKESPVDCRKLVSVVLLENQVEGPILKEVLKEQGIHSVIRDFIVSQHQLQESGMSSWGELLVLEEDYENAKFILNEYLNSLDTGTSVNDMDEPEGLYDPDEDNDEL